MMFLHFILYYLLMKGLQKLSSNPHVPSFFPLYTDSYTQHTNTYKHVLISFILKDFTFPSIYKTSLWIFYHRNVIVPDSSPVTIFILFFTLGRITSNIIIFLFTLNNGKVLNIDWMLVLVQTLPKCSISDTSFNAHSTLTKLIISFGLWLWLSLFLC